MLAACESQPNGNSPPASHMEKNPSAVPKAFRPWPRQFPQALPPHLSSPNQNNPQNKGNPSFSIAWQAWGLAAGQKLERPPSPEVVSLGGLRATALASVTTHTMSSQRQDPASPWSTPSLLPGERLKSLFQAAKSANDSAGGQTIQAHQGLHTPH